MQTYLTSWKEIAQYMSKGVRTVQRWEQYFGLPVRRLTASGHHAVVAVPEEINAWLQGQTQLRAAAATARPDAAELHRELAELREENQELRQRIRLFGGVSESGERDRLVLSNNLA